MKEYTLAKVSDIIKPKAQSVSNPDAKIEHLLTDSRSLMFPDTSLFFAISTKRGDGHKYIPSLYASGVRNFVIEHIPAGASQLYPDANFLQVSDSTVALQQLAAYHRGCYDIPVVGITGSKGKTTVKEWLYQLLQSEEEVLRSPRSFNSQIGVPLSVWGLDDMDTVAIFEAGISTTGEMQPISRVIRPNIAVLTNIGSEHDDGFRSVFEKVSEKCRLFEDADIAICNIDDRVVSDVVSGMDNISGKLWSVSFKNPEAKVYVSAYVNMGDSTEIEYHFAGKTDTIVVPFADELSVRNIALVLAVLLALGKDIEAFKPRLASLSPIDTRLEVLDGVNECQLLIDGYTSDMQSLSPALDFMDRRRTEQQSKTVILSDLIHEDNKDASQMYKKVAELLKCKGIERLIGIGKDISAHERYFACETRFFPSTEAFLEEMSTSDFDHELILIKGAPSFNFKLIGQKFEARQHETVLEVNLDAMTANYNFFKSFIRPETGIVAMVKAGAYGAGAYELAKSLQSIGAAYLAVAAHDEGVDLRRAGITMPIMVLNPKVVNYPALFAYRLEPEIYDFQMLKEIVKEGEKCGITDYPVHIKIDSGMHRLGFLKEDMKELKALLLSQNVITPKSVFSHLAAADNPSMDDYTQQQFDYFDACCDELQEAYPGHHIMRHILNSTGIVRFSQHQHDMVRLGIGLYGIPTLDDGSMSALRPVSSLHTVVISVKKWPEGTTIGYNRNGLLHRESIIATIPVGYADGIDRHLGNGHASFIVNGHRCPTVGNICMDICMIDVTDCPGVKAGDRVEIFGNNVTAVELAEILDTIPYEILTSVSQRVKRVYYRE